MSYQSPFTIPYTFVPPVTTSMHPLEISKNQEAIGNAMAKILFDTGMYMKFLTTTETLIRNFR